MITWQELQAEVAAATSEHGDSAMDYVRRVAYKELVRATDRPLLVYATAFQNIFKANTVPQMMSIDLNDKEGFKEVMNGINGKQVDLFIHSPGGSAEATESIVDILRTKLSDIRVIVTGTAKSAATMLAMAGNSILMDDAGELGPIDPQIALSNVLVPAGSLKEEFDKASVEIAENPDKLPAWLPILEKYTPALLVQCDNYTQLAQDLVSEWLKKYMFKGNKNRKELSDKVAKYLANEKNTLSHARRINRNKLESLGVVVNKVEDLPEEAQKTLRKVHLAIMMTLDSTNAYKIFENSNERALIRQVNIQPIPNPVQ